MIKVLLADNQALVRAGFRALLDAQPDIEVVAEASDGAAAVRLAVEQCAALDEPIHGRGICNLALGKA